MSTVAPGTGAGTARALSHGHWTELARSPLGTRYGATVVWDGRELLELGGSAGGSGGGVASDGGAAYDPATRRWRRLTSAPAAVLPNDAAAVWTGRQEFVFGGPSQPNEAAPNVAGLYDPAADRWTVTSTAPVGPFDGSGSAVWTGSRVIVAGFTRAHTGLQAAAYNPVAGTWTTLHPPIGARHPSEAASIVATDDGVLLWSEWGRSEQTGPNTFTGYSGVDVFRLSASGRWTNVTGGWPQHFDVETPVFTGTKVLLGPAQIWCGECPGPLLPDARGAVVDPKTLRRRAIPHGPLDGLSPEILWTGAAEVSVNAGGEEVGRDVRVLPGDIAFWDPVTGKWTRGPRAPAAIGAEAPVWDGTHMFVLAQGGKLLSFGG